jgi:hypothetical protein
MKVREESDTIAIGNLALCSNPDQSEVAINTVCYKSVALF